jgi:hypothetical protein
MKFDFSTDDETIQLFQIAVHFLQVYFSYAEEQAIDMVNQYYSDWQNIHDDDFYHHISSYEIAIRAHYFIKLKGKQESYIEWKRDNDYFNPPQEAFAYFRKHYYNR